MSSNNENNPAPIINRGPEPVSPTPWEVSGSPYTVVDANGEWVVYLQQLQPFPDSLDMSAMAHRVSNWGAACDLIEKQAETIRRLRKASAPDSTYSRDDMFRYIVERHPELGGDNGEG